MASYNPEQEDVIMDMISLTRGTMESFAALSQALPKKQKKFGQASILSEINQLPSKKSQTHISALAKALTPIKYFSRHLRELIAFYPQTYP